MILWMSTALAVELGSYGRVTAGADASGGGAEPVSVVAYGSRLEKHDYLELDLTFDEIEGWEAVITPALQGELFHADGQWDADLALRNLYAEGALDGGWSTWAGSRMWRGDDLHLFDVWPLDDLNLVGGGAGVESEGWGLRFALGLNRLEGDDWQLQVGEVPQDGAVGTEEVLILDRQRVIAGLRADVWMSDLVRLRTYAELQGLPAGEREVEGTPEELPADRGTRVGGQLTLLGDSTHHVWLVHATGLSSYDELAIPLTGLAADSTVHAARQSLAALSGHRETEAFSLLFGSYVRRFVDADGHGGDADDGIEAHVAFRPAWWATDKLSIGVELAEQWLRPDGLNPRTGDHDIPMVTKLSVLPALQPERGAFARPQLRLQYTYSLLNDDARLWFHEDDARRAHNHQHFFGLGAEWWINSQRGA